jgi:hypothetical protein
MFALGHVRQLVAATATTAEYVVLVVDAVLAAGMTLLLFRVPEVWLLWPVHVALDLTQFVWQRWHL